MASLAAATMNLVVRVVPAKPIGTHLGARGCVAGHAHGFHPTRQRSAAMSDIISLHNPGDRFQGRTDETIAGRVDGQLIESASHQAARQQLVALGRQIRRFAHEPDSARLP